MKKAFKLALFTIFFLALALFGVLYFAANSIIAKFQPELEGIASRSAGTKVSFGALKASVFPGVSLVASDIKLGSGGDLGLKGLDFDLALLPALSGKLEISRLTFAEPVIKLIRGRGGLRLEGVTPEKAARADSPKIPAAEAGKGQHANPLPEFFKLKLQKFGLSNGHVSIKDETSGEVKEISALNASASLGVEADKFTLTDFRISGKFENLPFKASFPKADYALNSGQVTLSGLVADLMDSVINADADLLSMPLSGQINLSSPGINLSKLSSLSEFAPKLKELDLSGVLKPELKIKLRSAKELLPSGTLELSKLGLNSAGLSLSDLNGKIILNSNDSGLGFISQELNLNLNKEALKLALEGVKNGDNLKVSKLAVLGLGGSINSSLALALDSSQFNNTLDLTSLDISKLAALSPKPLPKIVGTLQKFRSNLSGSLGENLNASLRGQGDLSVTDTFIPGVNIAALVLKSVKELPFLAGALWELLPPKIRERLAADQTVVRSLKASFSLADSQIQTSDLVLQSDLFSLEGKGSIGLDSNIDLTCVIHFAPDFSADIVQKAKDLRNILDEQDRLTIPLKLRGKTPGLSVTPDLSKLLKAGTQKILQEKAGDLLNKALGGKSGGKGLGKLLGF